MNDSIWAKTVSLPAFPRLEQNIKTDVLIVGGGMAGLLCAFFLKQAGVDYALIEADRICCGITRNTTAKLTSQHGLIYGKIIKQFGQAAAHLYWDANEKALARYRQLASAIPCDFETKTAYVYEIGHTKKLKQELQALAQLHIPADYLDQVPLPFPAAGAICFPGQAQFHPLKFAAGIAHGLHIYEHSPAMDFTPKTVITPHGTIIAEKIIIATHFPILNKHGSFFLKLYQHRSYVLALEDAPHLDGMYVDESETGLSLRSYGNLLLLGGGSHRTGKTGGGWQALERAKHRYFPTTHETCRWATQDCMSLDGVPYIGPYSKHTPNLYVAAGFNKWGMTGAMIAAMVLTDLVQEKWNPYKSLFSPSRTILRPQLLINGFETTKNLLTPTRPRCPHMGCALKWNPQEHTWDCPCHGSRFTKYGSLLDNPATGDISM